MPDLYRLPIDPGLVVDGPLTVTYEGDEIHLDGIEQRVVFTRRMLNGKLEMPGGVARCPLKSE